eukprot:Amastigsp_a2130_43.p4 type:complete len:108 gc:universal Amastigsp_a2130_43:816-1139(+)
MISTTQDRWTETMPGPPCGTAFSEHVIAGSARFKEASTRTRSGPQHSVHLGFELAHALTSGRADQPARRVDPCPSCGWLCSWRVIQVSDADACHAGCLGSPIMRTAE